MAAAALAAAPGTAVARPGALAFARALAFAGALCGGRGPGGAKLQPALTALRAGGTRVIPAVPAAVLGGAGRGFACSALGGYGAVLPVCPALLCALRRHRDQNHPWHGRRIGGAAGPAAEVSVSAGAHTFSMFFPQGDESAVMTISTLPIFDRPGTVLPARGQQKRRPCRNADLHRAALLFPEHQTTIFP